MGKIKLECSEANHICDKTQYKEASLWEKIKLNFHLLYCRACQSYTARNSKLTKTIKNPKVSSVSPDEKSELQELLNKELGKS